MNEMIEALKRIESRLDAIERSIARPTLNDVLIKANYSCAEVAELTQQYGTKKASTYTVRLAYSEGRIPQVRKAEDGSWRVPRESVLHILSEGIPPERRQRSAV